MQIYLKNVKKPNIYDNKNKNAMSTYKINIPESGGTITAATYDSCITGMSMDIGTGQNQIVDSTGATSGNFTMHCTSNGDYHVRENTYRLVYGYDGGNCEHNIHIVQEAAPSPKATLKLSNGTTVKVPCNGDSELKRNEMTSLVTASDVVSVHVEDCVTKIGDYAFIADSFTSLTSITMADSVTEIGKHVHSASYGGAPLKSISFSNNLVSIGEKAFWGCDKLTSLNFPNTLTHLYDSCFRECNGITSVTIPDSVKVIGFDAFHLCDGLKEVTIGTGWTGTTGIGRSFENCYSLMKVTVKATSPANINDDYYFCDGRVLGRCWKDGFKILVPRNSVDAYRSATHWNRYEEVIEPIS